MLDQLNAFSNPLRSEEKTNKFIKLGQLFDCKFLSSLKDKIR